KLAPQLPEEGNASAGWTLSQVVRALAPVDLAAAQRLLKTLRERPNTEEYVLGQAERTVAMELAKTDSVAALQMAHAIPEARFRAQALASVAAKLPPERGSAVFREAFGAAAADNFSLGTMARIAALAYNADPALGHELFQQIQERASNRREYLPDVETGARAAAAFYLAREDAAAARLLLATESCRLRALGANGAWDLTKIAQAMAAVDAGRALEIARSIPATGETVNARFDALRKIAQYLLAAQDVRATMPFDRWGASDTWTPGQDE